MNSRIATTSVALLLAATALTGCATGAGTSMSDMPGMGQTTSAGATPPVTVSDADIMFVQMMIPHHQQAVTMAETILDKTDIDPRVTALAGQIEAAQEPEIQTMEGWLASWGVASTMASMDHMDDGMVSDDDMTALEVATGVEAARMFLQQMIVHHQGAIEMARTEIAVGSEADVVALARDVVTAQTAEIETITGILATL